MAIDVIFDIKGIADGSAALRKSAAAMNSLARAQQRLNATAPKGNNVLMVQHMHIARAGQAASRAIGPYQRLINAQNQLNRAVRSGNQVAIADARYKMALAQKSAGRASTVLSGGQGSFGQRLNNFVASTRFGKGAMPLVGRTAALMGIPIGAVGPIGVAVTAITALAKAALAASEYLSNIKSAQSNYGASIDEINKARDVGAAVGRGADEEAARLAGAAGAMENPQGVEQSRAMTYTGVYNPAGGESRVQAGLRAAKRLAMINDDQLRRRLAGSLGIGEEVEAYRQGNVGGVQGLSQDDIDKGQKIKSEYSRWVETAKSLGAKAINWMFNPDKFMGNDYSNQPKKDETKEYLRRIEQHTYDQTMMMRQGRNIMGGGDNAGNPYPRAWAMNQLNNKNIGDAIRLGAFSL